MEERNEYICDDRGFMENVMKIHDMTDEEFEKYIAEMKKKQNQN